MSNTPQSVQDTPLTIREHLDPDKHWIGETLAPPSQGEIEATVGTTAGPGESPFVARADHRHKIDPNLIAKTLSWDPVVSGFNVGSTGNITAIAVESRVGVAAGTRLIFLQFQAVCAGSGISVPGEVSVALPFPSPYRIAFNGHAEAGLRFGILANTIVTNSSSLLLRPLLNRPTSTDALRPDEIANVLGGTAYGATWGSGSWVTFNGAYIYYG